MAAAAAAGWFWWCGGFEPALETPAVGPAAVAPVVPAGVVAYQRPDGIYVKSLDGTDGPRRLAADARYPRFSPGGRSLAFVRGNDIGMVDVADGRETQLAGAGQGRAVAWHPDGKEVLFTDGDSIRAVALGTRHTRTVLEGFSFKELDMAGSRLVATVTRLYLQVRAFDLETGRHWELARGCSASLDPAGERVTNNRLGHGTLALLNWADGAVAGAIPAPGPDGFDNQFWSNHPDWIVSVTEGDKQDVYLHHTSGTFLLQVTDEGDCDRPDLFLY